MTITASKKATAIVAEMEKKKVELGNFLNNLNSKLSKEKARLFGRYEEEPEMPNMAQIMLMKQFTSSEDSPEIKRKEHQVAAVDLLQVQHQATRGSSDVSNKKAPTPQIGSVQSSPLLSATRKDEVTLSGKIDPENLANSRFSLAVMPIETSVYHRQQNVTFNDSPSIVQERISAQGHDRLSNYARSSGEKKDQTMISQNYMSFIDTHPKETNRKIML